MHANEPPYIAIMHVKENLTDNANKGMHITSFLWRVGKMFTYLILQ